MGDLVLGVKVLLFVDNRLVIQLTSHNDNLSRWFHHSVTSLRDLCLVSDRQAQWGGEKESGHGAGKEKKKKKSINLSKSPEPERWEGGAGNRDSGKTA